MFARAFRWQFAGVFEEWLALDGVAFDDLARKQSGYLVTLVGRSIGLS